MRSTTYHNYIQLLNLLLNNGELTYEEITLLWDNPPTDDVYPPIRTFHEYKKGIKEMFGVDIECDRKRNVYYVKNPEVLEDNKPAQWLLDKYSIPKGFSAFNRLKDRVLLEEIPLGQAFLGRIMEAMRQNVELKVDYQQYQREDLQTFHFQPYALKVYNHRWYLLGYLKEQKDVRTIALDRIHTLDKLTTTFSLPAKFDAHKYFENVIGIYVDKDLPVEEIKIRAYGTQADYLRSTPLHNSQREGRSKHGEFAEFTYRLCVTPDLISQLLAMGENVEILKPKSLREEVVKKLRSTLQNYNIE